MSELPSKLNQPVNLDSVKDRSRQAIGLAKTEAARNSFILFGGNIINTLISMVAVIIVSRALGPHDFGVIATFNAVLGTLVGLTEFGLSTAAVKLISENLNKSQHHANVIMRVIFFAELASGALVLLLGLLFSVPLANALGGPHLLFAVRMGFIAGSITSAAAFFGPFFVAHKQFVKNALVNFSGPAFKTGSVLIMLGLSILSLHNVIIAYTLTPILFFAVAYSFVPKGFKIKAAREEEKSAFQEVFHYSKWVFLSYVATSIASNLDTFLVSRYRGSSVVGVYTAAQQLASVMPMLIGAVNTVLLPKFSQYTKRHEYQDTLGKMVLGLSMIALALLPAIYFAQIPIKLIFGHRFVAAIPIFKILMAAYLIALFSNSIAVIIYARSKHKILTYLNYAGLVITFLAYIALIPRYGAIGAATTYLITNIIAAAIIIPYSLRIVRELPE